MKLRNALLIIALVLALPLLALAQGQSSSSSQAPQEEAPTVWGDYTVRGSIELGGHVAESSGSEQMYSTLVDINSGPRILEQELSMQSRSGVGGMFDNLFMNSFGFGGEPESMARLRLEKHHWYNFVALYRRNKNIFDYNLFANPMNLNPGIVTCGVGCSNAFDPTALPWYSNTTRLMAMTRNMGDFSLTLLPQSSVSFRLGWSRNASYGELFTTLEAPLRSILSEDSQWKSDRFQFGVDLKGLPRTTISFDVFIEKDKNDIGFSDAANLLYTSGNNLGQQILFNGQPIPVDTGLLYPPLGGTLNSCAGANTQSIFPGNLFLLSSGCSGVLINSGTGGGYFRRANLRTIIPTGQVSFQSNYFSKLDLSGSLTYSRASSDFLNYSEFAHLNSNQVAAPAPGTVSTSSSNLFLYNGSPNANRISANADLAATYHINKSWWVTEKFRWLNWRQHGVDDENRYGCWLPTGAAFATNVGTVGTFTSLLNPCFNGIMNFINPAGGGLIATAGSVGAGRGNYLQSFTNGTLNGERSYFNTFKVNWQPSRHLQAYVGYRFARRSFQDGNEDITGLLWAITSNFVHVGGGVVPTTPQCNVATTGCDPLTGIITSIGDVDTAEINQHTALAGVTVRPWDAWRINADLEWLYADNMFTMIYPRHQQRIRVYSTYKLKPWLSLNGGVHFVESRNGFAAGEEVEGSPGTLLFPSSFISDAYGHKDHWRYYTAGLTSTRQKLTLDLGWTMLQQDIKSATCMPMPNNAFAGTVTAPPSCNNSATARALLLAYDETTHTGYFNASYPVTRRVTLRAGYEVTGDNGRTNWLRSDDLTPMMVVADIYGNSPPLAGNPITPCPGGDSGAGCIFQGPFPDQPLGPQATNWHKAHAGLDVDIVKNIQFKGTWSYYDYNSKDNPPSLQNLQVLSPRDFHANVGTLSLRYSF